MQTLTHSQFIAKLIQHAGAAPVGIEALTDAKARKTGNPFPGGAVFKHIRAVGFVGADYGKAVQREGERQGAEGAEEFQAMPLPWGAWHAGAEGKVIAHKGGFYLRTQTTPGQRKRQPAKVLAFRDATGRFLSRDEVKPFLPAPSVSVRQSAAGVGEGDASAQVMVRTYSFDSIRKVRFGGKTFELVRG